jgi:hypothetical protein
MRGDTVRERGEARAPPQRGESAMRTPDMASLEVPAAASAWDGHDGPMRRFKPPAGSQSPSPGARPPHCP